MEDITPLNLEDHPKLFGMRYDQLIAILGSLIVSTQLYSWMNPCPFAGQDLRLDFAIFLGLIGPIYALVTLNNGSAANWENLLNFYFASQILIPGPDPNTVRFLTDEELPEFSE
jgi:hypothetical protein